MRLVKGAYWDTEIKRAQERGLADYPVFTRKAMTDLCYMACVKQAAWLRAARLFPQFATHNALTVASVIEDAGGVEGFEFQRLYGMGEALYEALHRRAAGSRLPRLCAGRRPSRSARLSGAAAPGERRQFLLRLGRRRPAACRSRRFCAGRRAGSATPATRGTKTFRCRAISIGRNGRIRPASNSANAQASTRCSPRFAPPRRPRPKPRRWSTGSRCPASNARWCRRSTAIPSASCAKATRRSRARRWPPPRPASRRGRRRPARSAPQRSNAPPIGWSKNAAR